MSEKTEQARSMALTASSCPSVSVDGMVLAAQKCERESEEEQTGRGLTVG